MSPYYEEPGITIPMSTVRERPILFSSPMVRAILAGTKTQTRRLVTPQPVDGDTIQRESSPGQTFIVGRLRDSENAWRVLPCPYGVPGDRLWVRETFRMGYGSGMAHYRADEDECAGGPWTPSIHMPRFASRISLEVTSVRVERLQAISEEDAIGEGARFGCPDCADLCGHETSLAAFVDLWDSINGKRAPWSSDPWVWVLGFRRMESGA